MNAHALIAPLYAGTRGQPNLTFWCYSQGREDEQGPSTGTQSQFLIARVNPSQFILYHRDIREFMSTLLCAFSGLGLLYAARHTYCTADAASMPKNIILMSCRSCRLFEMAIISGTNTQGLAELGSCWIK